ncbi:MAG: helicase HerA-like domain-containing protein, partial [Patescibacteria group bacterium]
GLYDSTTAAVTESGLTIHKCSNWNYSGRVCNTNFALSDTQRISTGDDRAIVNASNFSAFLITEYTCGNSLCQVAYGETASTCAGDCATASPAASSGGGGGGGVATTPVKEGISVGGLQISLTKIDRELNIGENITEQLSITNTKQTPLTISLSLESHLSKVMEVQSSITIEGGASVIVPVFITGAKEGAYRGNLFMTSSTFNQTIPIIILVKSRNEKLLDIAVALDKKVISPGGDLPFRVSAFNLGQLKRYDIHLRYEIVNKEANMSFAFFEESAAIETSLSLSRKLQVPESTEYGQYQLIVTAKYDSLQAVTSSSFEVGAEPVAFLTTLKEYAPLVFVGIVLALMLIMGGYYIVSVRKRVFKQKMKEMQEQSIYPFPDFANLPQSKYAYLGLVADTEEKAYFDYTQLNKHTLIAGGTGSGKTVTGMLIVEELLKKGASVVVFDPVGQWTGFAKKNTDKAMREKYKKFGM